MLAVALTLVVSGCVGYRFGARSLFADDIQTVAVPVFQSELYRPGIEQQLTEAIVKEIETRSHMKVVPVTEADSVLSGRIVQLQKKVIAEDINDQPRVTELSFAVQVNWIDRAGNHRMQRAEVPVPGLVVSASQSVSLIPEAGQSFATAELRAIERLARQIVSEMEAVW